MAPPGFRHGVAGAAGGADLADQVQDHVLGVMPHGVPSKVARRCLGLCCTSDCVASTWITGGADAEGDGAHAAVRAGAGRCCRTPAGCRAA